LANSRFTASTNRIESSMGSSTGGPSAVGGAGLRDKEQIKTDRRMQNH
jgi:hypothetical protein